MWQDIGVEATIAQFPYVAYRPTLVNRTAAQYHLVQQHTLQARSR